MIKKQIFSVNYWYGLNDLFTKQIDSVDSESVVNNSLEETIISELQLK